jgi:S1-C subfamily serine protease
MRRWLLTYTLGTTLLLSTGLARGADGESGERVYKSLIRSTVWVIVPIAKDADGKTRVKTGTGSVVDLKQRMIVTNYHVVGDKDEAFVLFPIIKKDGEIVADRKFYLEKGARVRGKVVAKEPKHDLALIQVETIPPGVKPVPIAAKSPAQAQRLHSIGNPGASGALWVYTEGTVRAVYQKPPFKIVGKNGEGSFTIDAKIVETQSPVNQGDSGGPVVNDRGELVAVTQGHLNDAQARLMSLCIDVSEVRKILASKGISKVTSSPPATSGRANVEPTNDLTTDKSVEDAAAKSEREAQVKLRYAKKFADDGKNDAARTRCKEIIEKFPKTKAAEEAKQLLDKLPK